MAQFVLCEHPAVGFYYYHPACAPAENEFRIVFTDEILVRDTPCVVCMQPLVAPQPDFPLPIRVDALIHTDAHPFCGDFTCPCYHDHERKQHYVEEPLLDGLLTEEEADRIYAGQQL